MELTKVTPDLNLYDDPWPIWTYQAQLPPAKFVFDDETRRGVAVDSLVSGGCIISGATVRRSLLFSNVYVHSFAEVSDSVLLPDVDIGRGARLHRAVLDGADLSGADLGGADLTGASMKRAVLAGVNLEHARLDDADLTDVLRAPAPLAYVDDRPLEEILAEHEAYCESDGARGRVVSLPEVDFRPLRNLRNRKLTALVAPRSILFGLDLQGVELQGADLSGCDLRGVNLRDADLRGAKLTDAQLARADLRGARMGPLMIAEGRYVRTDFTRASLRNADFRGASAPRARFLDADVGQARMAGCDLTAAEFDAAGREKLSWLALQAEPAR